MRLAFVGLKHAHPAIFSWQLSAAANHNELLHSLLVPCLLTRIHRYIPTYLHSRCYLHKSSQRTLASQPLAHLARRHFFRSVPAPRLGARPSRYGCTAGKQPRSRGGRLVHDILCQSSWCGIGSLALLQCRYWGELCESVLPPVKWRCGKVWASKLFRFLLSAEACVEFGSHDLWKTAIAFAKLKDLVSQYTVPLEEHHATVCHMPGVSEVLWNTPRD